MKILHKIAVLVLAVFMGLFYCYPIMVHAENMVSYDDTSIDEDMADIDVTFYPENPLGKPLIIMVQEYCYTIRKNLSEYYGLYIYVYNPTQKEISTDKNNVVNMAVSYGDDGKPTAYENVKLIYLDKNSQNRFYKFKIENSSRFLDLEKSYMAKYEKRRYDIAGIQLYHVDGTDSKDSTVAKTYYFTGYGKGCGADYNAESTLECNEEVLETLSLKVTPTQFRPGDSNGKDDYTRDSLHSVFFSVPNKNLKESGDLWGFKAQWLDAVLKPALVTGNQDFIVSIKDCLGEDISMIDDFYYGYLSEMSSSKPSSGPLTNIKSKYTFNMPSSWTGFNLSSEKILSTLYLIFNSGSDANSADSYVVSSDQILKEAKKSADIYGGELINGKYSKSIFESVADEYTVVELNNDDSEFNLASGKVTKTFWQELFGGSTYVPDEGEFDHLKVIVPVTTKDISDLLDFEVADAFCVGLSDVPSLREAVELAESKNETVHLLRYQVTNYTSIEATLYKKSTAFGLDEFGRVDTNAYFFQETVNLDFEVIDLKFKKEDVVTVIPVVMSPIDIFPSSEPPVNTTSDSNDWRTVLQIILGILVLLLILYLLRPVLPYIVKGIVWLINLPIKGIKKLAAKSKKRSKKKNKKRR